MTHVQRRSSMGPAVPHTTVISFLSKKIHEPLFRSGNLWGLGRMSNVSHVRMLICNVSPCCRIQRSSHCPALRGSKRMDARSRCSQAYGRKLKIAVKLQRQPCAFCFCIDTRNKLARRSAISLLLFLLFVVALFEKGSIFFSLCSSRK